jgi:hypothetical protein
VPRKMSVADSANLQDLARLVTSELELRLERREPVKAVPVP